MYYDEEMLLSIVKNVKKGDVVKIKTCFKELSETNSNTILIIHDKGSLKAVWYDGAYKGIVYPILNYQIITEIVKRGVNVEEFFKTIKIKQYDTKGERTFLSL